MARMLYVANLASTGELWRSTVAEPTAAAHFEEVLDFPAGIIFPSGLTSHADRLYVADESGKALWRSTVADPTTTAHFVKVLDFPSGLAFPRGLTSHADRLYVADDGGNELWRSTVAEPTATNHFEKVLDFPGTLVSPLGLTSHADRIYVTDNVPGELWRSTVAEPTATNHFEKVLDFPGTLVSPFGLTSHADRLYVADDGGNELWRSTVAEPTLTSHFEEVLNFPTGLTSPQGMASHDPDPVAPVSLAGDLAGGAGALTGNLEAQTTGTVNLAGHVAGGAGALTGDLTAGVPVDPLVLADFDQAGRQFDVLALIEAGTVEAGTAYGLWARSPRDAVGLLLDGEADIDGDAEPLTRLRWNDVDDVLILNDNGVTDLGAYFTTGGDGEDLTISIQDVDGVASETVAAGFLAGGGNFLQLQVTAALAARVQNIDTGDRFIFALWRSDATPAVTLAGGVVGGAAVLTGNLAAQASGSVDLAGRRCRRPGRARGGLADASGGCRGFGRRLGGRGSRARGQSTG